MNSLSINFINIISKIEGHFTNPNNCSSIAEKNIEELELIHEISNYWSGLYQQLFKEIQEEQMMFEWDKTKYLQTIVKQELKNKSQILILVERKVEAQLISELVGNFATVDYENVKFYIEIH